MAYLSPACLLWFSTFGEQSTVNTSQLQKRSATFSMSVKLLEEILGGRYMVVRESFPIEKLFIVYVAWATKPICQFCYSSSILGPERHTKREVYSENPPLVDLVRFMLICILLRRFHFKIQLPYVLCLMMLFLSKTYRNLCSQRKALEKPFVSQ